MNDSYKNVSRISSLLGKIVIFLYTGKIIQVLDFNNWHPLIDIFVGLTIVSLTFEIFFVKHGHISMKYRPMIIQLFISIALTLILQVLTSLALEYRFIGWFKYILISKTSRQRENDNFTLFARTLSFSKIQNRRVMHGRVIVFTKMCFINVIILILGNLPRNS